MSRLNISKVTKSTQRLNSFKIIKSILKALGYDLGKYRQGSESGYLHKVGLIKKNGGYGFKKEFNPDAPFSVFNKYVDETKFVDINCPVMKQSEERSSMGAIQMGYLMNKSLVSLIVQKLTEMDDEIDGISSQTRYGDMFVNGEPNELFNKVCDKVIEKMRYVTMSKNKDTILATIRELYGFTFEATYKEIQSVIENKIQGLTKEEIENSLLFFYKDPISNVEFESKYSEILEMWWNAIEKKETEDSATTLLDEMKDLHKYYTILVHNVAKKTGNLNLNTISDLCSYGTFEVNSPNGDSEERKFDILSMAGADCSTLLSLLSIIGESVDTKTEDGKKCIVEKLKEFYNILFGTMSLICKKKNVNTLVFAYLGLGVFLDKVPFDIRPEVFTNYYDSLISKLTETLDESIDLFMNVNPGTIRHIGKLLQIIDKDKTNELTRLWNNYEKDPDQGRNSTSWNELCGFIRNHVYSQIQVNDKIKIHFHGKDNCSLAYELSQTTRVTLLNPSDIFALVYGYFGYYFRHPEGWSYMAGEEFIAWLTKMGFISCRYAAEVISISKVSDDLTYLEATILY